MKKYIIIIVAIFVLIGVTIAIASNIKVEKETKYFMYVKNNNLILWNQTNNQKYVLNSNFDTKSKIMLEIYSRYSADKSKIIYADNIDNNYVDLKYVDVNNINEESSKIIAEDVLVYEVTEKGIVYIKDMDLYYYDYNITNEVASDITSYAITKDKKNLYYHLETGEVYKVNLDNLEQTIVASNMDGVGTYGDMVLSYQKKDALFDLYNGDELISDKVINQIDGEGDTLYFARYEGDLEEFKTSEDILAGKKAWVNGQKITGTMPNRGAVSQTLNAGGSYTIPEGYHNGSGVINSASLASQTEGTATADNISNGMTAWVNGNLITGNGKDISDAISDAKVVDVMLYKWGTMPNGGAYYPSKTENYIIDRDLSDVNYIILYSIIDNDANASGLRIRLDDNIITNVNSLNPLWNYGNLLVLDVTNYSNFKLEVYSGNNAGVPGAAVYYVCTFLQSINISEEYHYQ